MRGYKYLSIYVLKYLFCNISEEIQENTCKFIWEEIHRAFALPYLFLLFSLALYPAAGAPLGISHAMRNC